MKVEAYDEAKAGAPTTLESVWMEVSRVASTFVTHSLSATQVAEARAAEASVAATCGDPRALLNEAEAHFFPILKTALARCDCQVLAKVHLPALTKRADEALQPAAALNRALAVLRCWEANFAICRGDSLVVVAVVRLRLNAEATEATREPERANLEEALHATLAAARIPVVLITEAASYDPGHIAKLIQPHLAEA